MKSMRNNSLLGIFPKVYFRVIRVLRMVLWITFLGEPCSCG